MAESTANMIMNPYGIWRSVVTSFEYPKPLTIKAPKLLTDPLTTCVERPKRKRNHVFGSSKASTTWYRLKCVFFIPA
jgi:hypothetical protein